MDTELLGLQHQSANHVPRQHHRQSLCFCGGAGLTLGEINNYSSNACIGGKFGVNAIMGLEYQLPAPLTLGLDFRPGYGLFFDQDYNINAFDWKLVVALRYTL